MNLDVINCLREVHTDLNSCIEALALFECERAGHKSEVATLTAMIDTLSAENDNFRNRVHDEEVLTLRNRIDGLNQTIDFLIQDNKRSIESAKFYRQIQDLCKVDEMLQDAWSNFIMTMKMRLETNVPGITSKITDRK